MSEEKKLFTQKIQHQEFINKWDEFMESHNEEVVDQNKQIEDILEYLTNWLINHILYVDGQITKRLMLKIENFNKKGNIRFAQIITEISLLTLQNWRSLELLMMN